MGACIKIIYSRSHTSSHGMDITTPFCFRTSDVFRIRKDFPPIHIHIIT